MSNMQSLIESLGIPIEFVDGENVDFKPALIWGEVCYLAWETQLVSVDGKAIVRTTQKGLASSLHEACHALFAIGDEDCTETHIFAFEYLVAQNLTGEDLTNWRLVFMDYVLTSDGQLEGVELLEGKTHPDWERAFDWLEDHGFTVNGKPVFGLGQGSHFEDDVRSPDRVNHIYWTSRAWGLQEPSSPSSFKRQPG